jgi:hypothetical protein
VTEFLPGLNADKLIRNTVARSILEQLSRDGFATIEGSHIWVIYTVLIGVFRNASLLTAVKTGVDPSGVEIWDITSQDQLVLKSIAKFCIEFLQKHHLNGKLMNEFIGFIGSAEVDFDRDFMILKMSLSRGGITLGFKLRNEGLKSTLAICSSHINLVVTNWLDQPGITSKARIRVNDQANKALISSVSYIDIILEALHESATPVHKDELFHRVESGGLFISEPSIQVSLSKHKAIRSFGGGVFGLTERFYDLETPAECWLYDMLETKESIPDDELERIGIAQGFTRNELRVAAALSLRVCFSRTFSRTAYQTRAFAHWRKFDTWFSRNMVAAPPDHAALLEGFRRTYERYDYATILQVAQVLEESHNHILSEDLEDFVLISRSRVS